MNDPSNATQAKIEESLRAKIREAKRILIKVGTSVITQKNHTAALGRISYVVEQIVELKEHDRQIILVTSGAVGLGSKVLLDRNSGVFVGKTVVGPHQVTPPNHIKDIEKRASAAIGQARLMALYDLLFAHKNVSVSQILLKHKDLREPNIYHLAETCNFLLQLGVVPILNENDVTNVPEIVSKAVEKPTVEHPILTDNDALACHLASYIGVDLVILLTDVEGVYTAPPSTPGAKVISLINSLEESKANTKTPEGMGSGLGRGGMAAKIAAAGKALNSSRVPMIVIGNGFHQNTIVRVARGEDVGTLIVRLPPNKAKL